jgi:hypothetical protein
MGEGSSGSGPLPPPGDGGGETTRVSYGREPATRPVEPSYEPTFVPARQPEPGTVPPAPATDVTVRPAADGPPAPTQPTVVAPRRPEYAAGPGASPSADAPPGAPPAGAGSDVLRYGPGVPVSQAGVAAESVWRTGHRPGPPARQVRLRRVRRLLGTALTVILLIAAGVVVWLRFFDHPAFHVTGAHITQEVKTSCGMDVTGRIDTNGSAGTVSYQWVFRPQTQAPQPLSQTVVAGQHAVYVTVAVEGQGHGTVSQAVTLDVLGPDPGTASTTVTISC